jgi:hypothetical protein
MSEMQVMDPSGHLTITWTADNREEVDAARATFNEMVKQKGYRAFHVEGKGRQGRPMSEFDPSVEEAILIPHMVGG